MGYPPFEKKELLPVGYYFACQTFELFKIQLEKQQPEIVFLFYQGQILRLPVFLFVYESDEAGIAVIFIPQV